MREKNVLRKLLLGKRRNIPLLSRRIKSRRILRELSKEPIFRKAEHVAFYFSVEPEVDTKPLLKKILKTKNIYLPRIGPRKSLALCRVRSLSGDLKKRAHPIWEPRTFCRKRPAGKMDLIVLPGVAFDKRGGRLGRGGGYYDRLLKKSRKIFKIGLCFREQLVKKVPMKAHDVWMDRVITD